MDLIQLLFSFGLVMILIFTMISSDVTIISQTGVIILIFFIMMLIYGIIEYIKETLIPSVTQATSSITQATTRSLGNLYSLSIDFSTNRYFSAMLISLICLILCINIFKTKTEFNTKVEIDSSNAVLKKMLQDL